jgi:hypothetical protein
MCFAWCDERWLIHSLSCESPDRVPLTWCYYQADEERSQCEQGCWEQIWEEEPPPPPPPNNPPGTPPTCVDGGPEPPGEEIEPNCDHSYLGWCSLWCEACSSPALMPGCYAECDADYCPSPTSCRDRVSDSCADQCNWAELRETCYEQCLDYTCNPG